MTPKSSLPPEFVVIRAALQPRSSTAIGFQAKRLRRSRELAALGGARKGLAASIYIFDNHGTLVHQERGDGMLYNNMHTSMLKKLRPRCKPGNLLRFATPNCSSDPSGLPRQLAQFGFFTNSGGLPIVVDGDVSSTIGVAA